MNRYITLILLFLCVGTMPAPASAADGTTKHKVWLDGTEDRNTFTANVDGQKFDTLASLEVYLATLPSGDRVDCRFDGGALGADNPDMSQRRRDCRELQKFCQDHKLSFIWSAIRL